jgi:hypothetical protein
MALETIGDLVGRNAKKPRGKRRSPRFESPHVGDRLVKHVGHQIFGLSAVAEAVRYVGGRPGQNRVRKDQRSAPDRAAPPLVALYLDITRSGRVERRWFQLTSDLRGGVHLNRTSRLAPAGDLSSQRICDVD